MNPKPLAKRKCKICKESFQPLRPFQPACLGDCATKWMQKQNEKAWKKEKKVMKERIKSRTDYLKDLEKYFNIFIRLRDKSLPCISCGATSGVQFSAGHYFPTTHGSVRFNEDNVHKQCWNNCNRNKHGNLAEYLPRLIKKIGQKRFDAMSKIKNQERLHLSIPELKELKVHYKNLIKQTK